MSYPNYPPAGPPYQPPPNEPPRFPVDTSDLKLTNVRADPPPQKKKPDVAKAILISLGVITALIIAALAFGNAETGSPAVPPLPTSAVTSEPAGDSITEDPTTPEPTLGSPSEIDKSDIKLKIKILGKECYGYGIGCNVEYRVSLESMDDTLWPESGEVEVTYKVTGGEDGAVSDSFVIYVGDGKYEKPWEDLVSTPSRATKLKVTITDVEYSE